MLCFVKLEVTSGNGSKASEITLSWLSVIAAALTNPGNAALQVTLLFQTTSLCLGGGHCY